MNSSMEKPEVERRFLIRPGFSERDFPKSVRYHEFHIVQTYLRQKESMGSSRVREIWQERTPSQYFLTRKRPTESCMTKMEDERKISYKEYQKILREADPERSPIGKRRLCFKWKRQEFELDIFSAPEWISGLVILEIELSNEQERVILPPFLPIVAEVTDAKGLSNSNLAKRI